MNYREKMDKNILESLKYTIYSYLQKKGIENAELFKQNMDNVEGLYVENSVEKGGPKMESRGARDGRPAEIMIDKQFVKINSNGKIVGIDTAIAKLIYSQLGHELIHAAARYNGYTGIMKDRNKRGLNEGLTQMITEKIFGYTVSPNTDGYSEYKKVAKILDATFGEKIILNSYFNHTDDLEEACNSLSRDNNFYINLNENLTFMYNMSSNSVLKDQSYKSLMGPQYYKMNELVFQKLCAQIIIPKLRTLEEEEQRKYLISILDGVRDDQEIMQQLIDTITNYVGMSSNELYEEEKRIEKEIKEVEIISQFVKQLYTEQDYLKLVTITEDGRVFLVNNPEIEIKNEAIVEKIFAHLYFKERNYTTEQIKKYWDRVCEKIDKNEPIIYNDSVKDNILEKKKALASIKYIAKENGYSVFNSLSECEQADSIALRGTKQPRESAALSFEDLKKVYERYTIYYEDDINNKWKMAVKDRKTGEKVDDVVISKISKFASLWAIAAGTKWYENEEIKGITYAFNEESEQIFNQFSQLVCKSMRETGTIDTETLYKEIPNIKYKHAQEILYKLLEDPTRLKIIYEFYKMQNPQSRLEIELAKTTSEFVRGISGDEFIKSRAEDIVTGIHQDTGDATEINELIELAERGELGKKVSISDIVRISREEEITSSKIREALGVVELVKKQNGDEQIGEDK